MSAALIARALLSILVIWMITYGLRGAPFLFLRRWERSAPIAMLGATMPLGVMIILVIFSLSEVDLGEPASWVPALAGLAVTGGLHWKWGNALLSIVGGILVFAAVQQCF